MRRPAAVTALMGKGAGACRSRTRTTSPEANTSFDWQPFTLGEILPRLKDAIPPTGP